MTLSVFWICVCGMVYRLQLCLCVLLVQIGMQAQATDPRSYVVEADDTSRTSLRFKVQEADTPRGPKEVENTTKHTYTLRHAQYFDLAGHMATAAIQIPYAVIDQDFSNSRRKGDDQSGMGDPMIGLAVGTYRTPAISREELKTYDADGLSSGCQVYASLPLGSYQAFRSSNPGQNRWIVIPECQLGWTQGNLLLEALANLNWFSDNDEYRGTTFSQANQYNFKFMASYGSLRSSYFAGTLEYKTGGETSRGGRADHNGLNNWVAGAMFYVKLPGNNSLKLIGELPVKTAVNTTKASEISLVLSHVWR
ncbi:transporter [Chitinibacter bivalviorum]|uniref:Transporter n=1 Tax=Chitinibacter bivalviorum TaxID=2739434 RepID=A0A7H9BEK9_9NEIS|nr:transporter [Chitinibacter bivalviorum]QLG86995.1 transporter [Chitinibacter bivalviorum]